MSGGGKKSSGVKLSDYYLSIHYGICVGPIDALRSLWIGEKKVWSGFVAAQDTVSFVLPSIFGGDDQEGGVGGQIEYLPGADDQLMPASLAAKLGLTSATCPGFRGLASIFMTGTSFNITSPVEAAVAELLHLNPGFWWGTNNPYLKATWAEVERIYRGWYPATAPIGEWEANSRTSSTLVSGATGNANFKWDTYGSLAIRCEGNTGVTSTNVIDIWNVDEQTSSTVVVGSDGLAGCHILDSGNIAAVKTANRSIEIRNSAGSVLSTISSGLATDETHTINHLDSFTVGGVENIFVIADNNLGDTVWIVSDGTSYADTATANAIGDYGLACGIVAGPTYVYAPDSTYAEVALFDWHTATETQVTPPGLTAAIDSIGYDDTTGNVIILTVDGNLFAFDEALTAQKYSNTDGVVTIGSSAEHTNTNKRWIQDGVAVVFERGGTIYTFGTATLTLLRTDTAADWSWPDSSESFSWAFYNAAMPGILLPHSLFDTDFWYLPEHGRADMNPAHIILETLTNTDWGMSAPQSSLDLTSFAAAADVLYAEDFGLSLVWVQQQTIEDFVKDILGHINATLYTNPATGLLTLKLIRADYDPDTLPVLDRDNCKIVSFGRKSWGETTNEIVVSWTNPDTEQTETYALQDNGNIAIQGGVVSDSRNYYGIRRSDLAQAVCARDLSAASWPLASAQVQADRTAWNYVPGGVVKLTIEEEGTVDLVVRIGTIDYGQPGDPKITLEVVEDIFGLPVAQYVDPAAASLWTDPAEAPRAIDHALPTTLTYFHSARAQDVSGATYPEVIAGMLAAQGGGDTSKFELAGPVTDIAGNETAFANLAARTIVARATLAADVAQEATTALTSANWSGLTQGEGPVVAGFILFGETEESAGELALITALASGTYTVKRGVLDTTPKAWPAGTPIWFFSNNASVSDPITRSALDTIDYKVLPITSEGMFDESDASPIPLTLTERPWLPSRPADVKIDGVAFGTYDAIAANGGVAPSSVSVTWANRNRLTEDSQVLGWTDAGVTAEDGQTTTVEVLNITDRSVLASNTGITGSSYALAAADFGTEALAIVRVTSERDGYASLQGHEITVKIGTGLLLTEDGGFLLFEDDSFFKQG